MGKRGRPRKQKIGPPKNLKYAQVVKKREGRKLKKVEKKVIFGEGIEQSANHYKLNCETKPNLQTGQQHSFDRNNRIL